MLLQGHHFCEAPSMRYFVLKSCMDVCMHLLLCYAAGSRQWLCKAGVLVRHVLGYNVQVAHRQRQILRHSALQKSRPNQ
jgi:hypothetical protein